MTTLGTEAEELEKGQPVMTVDNAVRRYRVARERRELAGRHWQEAEDALNRAQQEGTQATIELSAARDALELAIVTSDGD